MEKNQALVLKKLGANDWIIFKKISIFFYSRINIIECLLPMAYKDYSTLDLSNSITIYN